MARSEGLDILALEAAAALQDGVSYGRWKAMGGKVNPVADGSLPEGWKTCKRCGKAFKPKRGARQIYCSHECQYEVQKERDRDRKREHARAYHAKKKAMAAAGTTKGG